MWEASLGAMLAAGEGEGRGMTESVMGGKLTESGEGGRAGLSGLAQPLLVSSPPRQEAAVRAWPRAADQGDGAPDGPGGVEGLQERAALSLVPEGKGRILW